MKKFLVTSDFIDKETGDQIVAGAVFEADEEREATLRAAEVIGNEIAENYISPASNGNDDPGNVTSYTIEQFSSLKAEEQKGLLADLRIEGDASNEDKRVALYSEFVELVRGGTEG